MFSNTAFEAMYQYIGLELHSRFIEVITSQKVFGAAILMIFGVMFFMTTLQFFSRYMPGALVARRHVPLSRYVRITFCLFLGISLLKIGSNSSVNRFNGESWHTNPYIHGQLRQVEPSYRVSFVFSLISQTAEGFSALISRVIDDLFNSSASQLDAPNFFFKAVMFAGAATVKDPNLKRSIHFYTEECFDRLLPTLKEGAKENRIDTFFGDNIDFDQKLSDIVIETPDKTPYTCLDAKNEVRNGLKQYALAESGPMLNSLQVQLQKGPMRGQAYENQIVSDYLVNQFLDEHEGLMGVQKGSQLPTTSGRIFQYINRAFSWDGVISLFSGFGSKQYLGASLSASRAQEFSENLARAPHLAGFIKMILIAIFPWLIFAVVAGYWRSLAFWFAAYLSVLLWTPIWTLLYHIMVSISLSADVMEAFGRLNDGISLYSAALVTSRMNHIFAVYSWLQIMTGVSFSAAILWKLSPMFHDTEGESQPEFIDSGRGAASTVSGVAKAAGALL